MNKELREITQRLKEMAQKEAYKLWRLARKAQRHGCSAKLVEAIREEGTRLYNEMQTYPDRLVYWKTEYEFKYAFK